MNMKLDDETKEKIWKEITDDVKSHTTLLPGEKTIRMFAEESGLSYKQASTKLEKLEEEGVLESCWKLIKSKNCHVYKPIKQ